MSNSGEKSTVQEGPKVVPRHQLVLYRHRVDRITSILKLEEPDVDLFLNSIPFGGRRMHGSTDSGHRRPQSWGGSTYCTFMLIQSHHAF